jgi:Secretion system C-terminal sorting domain
MIILKNVENKTININSKSTDYQSLNKTNCSSHFPILYFKFILFASIILPLKESFATTYFGTPSDYLGYLPQLNLGDTLLLEAGTYTDRLNLDDIVGTENAPIVIMGNENTNDAVFTGNACCNTVSIERCAWLTIKNLTIDGQNIPYIDAVKAEGTNGNWAHHITIENLMVINHGGAALTVGVSTKCPAWDWVIRRNTFINPGLGMYLGNSDGTAPFINGIVEYNLVVNPIRYGIQIKHQNEGLRTIPGMTLSGKTVIRYNVISKAEGADPDTPRPNLLVGNFPATGDGTDDYYEIYGNLLWQNPTEGLFQGTGNVSFYNNILVNHQSGGWGIFSFPHNNFAPRNMYFFNNTILVATEGIDIDNPNPAFTQLVSGNAIFAQTPLDIGNVTATDNVTDNLANAANFLVNPSSNIVGLDLTPLPSALEGSPISFSSFTSFERFNWDFDGNEKGWNFRGAYAKTGAPDWELALEIRPEVTGMTTGIFPQPSKNAVMFTVFPNPAWDKVTVRFEESFSELLEVKIIDVTGKSIRTFNLENTVQKQSFEIPLENISEGVYFLHFFMNGKGFSEKIVVFKK